MATGHVAAQCLEVINVDVDSVIQGSIVRQVRIKILYQCLWTKLIKVWVMVVFNQNELVFKPLVLLEIWLLTNELSKWT